MTSRTRAPLPVGLVALALAAGGCGGTSSDQAGSTAGPAAPPTTPPAKPATPSLSPTERKLGTKPAIVKPSGPPPPSLVTRDLVKGHGAVARAGRKVLVQYVGVAYSTGQEFDASWDRGQAFPFQLGAGKVIPGWDQGIPGMRVGGRRQLIIPPGLAYGPQGQPPAIGPNETLIFDIDLLKVR